MDFNASYYLALQLSGTDKSYYFSTTTNDFALGDLVIVMTSQGLEAGVVTALPRPMSEYTSPLELKPILRRADERDLRDHERNVKAAKAAREIAEREIAALQLPMDLTGAFYSHDGSKVTITYTSSEKRVDFRELLKLLAPQISGRIELRQIAARDKAKVVGGIGICGLPLCCSTFLNQFEGISIQKAKNQMLALNIPKLSGPCGKLICCLNYEDDAYTEAKKEFPRIGTVINLDEGPYTISSYNVLSKNVTLVNATRSDYKTFSLEDVKAMLKGTYVRKVEIVKTNVEAELPSFGIEPAYKEQKTQQNEPKPQQKPNKNKDNRNDNRNRNHGNRNDQRQQQQQGRPDQKQQGRPDQKQQQNNRQDQKQQGRQDQRQGRNHRHNRHRPRRPNSGQGQGNDE